LSRLADHNAVNRGLDKKSPGSSAVEVAFFEENATGQNALRDIALVEPQSTADAGLSKCRGRHHFATLKGMTAAAYYGDSSRN
jgi:hypothetical protein